MYNGQGVSLAAEYVQFPHQEKIVDLAMAASCTLALTEDGDVYYWGKYQVWHIYSPHVCLFVSLLSICLFTS